MIDLGCPTKERGRRGFESQMTLQPDSGNIEITANRIQLTQVASPDTPGLCSQPPQHIGLSSSRLAPWPHRTLLRTWTPSTGLPESHRFDSWLSEAPGPSCHKVSKRSVWVARSGVLQDARSQSTASAHVHVKVALTKKINTWEAAVSKAISGDRRHCHEVIV